MSQVINTNIASLNSQRNLSGSQAALSVSLQRLSSGLRINTAKDDAAGLSISERFSAQVRGMDQARRNANDGVSLAQTAEGALGQMGNLLQRVRELAVQSANGTNSASDRQALNSEVGQLVSELDRFATSTQFNGLNLLDGSLTAVNYQVGANASQTISATSANLRANRFGTHQVGNSVQSNATTGTATVPASVPAAATAAQAAATAAAADGTLSASVRAAWSATATAWGLTGAAADGAWAAAAAAWGAAGGAGFGAQNGAAFASLAWQNMNNQASWVNNWTNGSATNWSLYVTNSAADLAAKNAAVAAANAYAGLTGSTFSTGVTVAVGPAVAAAGTLTINAGGSGTYAVGLNDSAADIAAGIGATGLTGLQVSARTQTELAFGAGGASSGAVTLYVSTIGKNGAVGSERAVSFNLASLTDRDSLLRAAASFNNSTQQTGVSASINDAGNALALTAADGSNIQLRKAAAGDSAIDLVLGKGSTATLAAASNGALQAAGQVTVNSTNGFSFQTDGTLSIQAGVLGDAAIAVSSTVSSGLKGVETLDVSTIANANQAMRIVDSALETLNGQRATMGALQNRFEMTISNLQTSSENMAAARSRIRDADFAAETASLTRNQVLQQAGVAMLAQANSLPNQVLALLR